MIRVIRSTIVVVITLAILLLLWQFAIAIVLFFLSLALAGALRPSITSIMSRQIPKRLALTIVYFLMIAFIVVSLLSMGPPFLDELQRASDEFAENYDRAKTEWPRRGTLFQQTIAQQLPPSAELYQALASEEGIPALRGIVGVAQNFFSILGYIAIVIVLSLYWSADQLRFERLGLSLLPTEYHPRALHAWRSIELGVGAYLRSEFVQSLLAGSILWLIYSALGVAYPTLLASWVAVARLIPWFGALIAVLPALFIVINSSTVGLVAIISTMAVLFVLKEVIEPRVFHRNKYSSLLIVLFVVGLAQAFGFIGVILAPPLAVAAQILFEHLYPFPASMFSQEVSEKVNNMGIRIAQLRRNMRKRTSPRNRLLINRIYYLVRRTANYLQEY